jgi:hypothetical protein
MDETTRQGMDRRTALKTIGAGTAAIWVAPTVLSTASAFAAGSGAPEVCQRQSVFACGGPVGDCSLPGDPPLSCLCDINTENGVFCGVDSACTGACTTSADCPDGSFCVDNSTNCCEGIPNGSCSALCQGGVSPASVPKGTRMQSGTAR